MAATPPTTPAKSSKAAILLTAPTAYKDSSKTSLKQISQIKTIEISEKRSEVDINESGGVAIVAKVISKAPKYPTPASVKNLIIEGTEKAAVYPTPPSSPILQAEKVKQVPNVPPITGGVQTQESLDSAAKNVVLSAKFITTKLNIEKWLCGNKKGDGNPCRMWSQLERESKRDEIRDLVLRLSLADVNTTAFDSALEELAQSYSCHHHNNGRFLEYRVGNWKDLLTPATGAGSQLRKLLWNISTECVEAGCKNYIGGQRVQNCNKTCALILQQKGTIEYYQHLLRVWDANTRCNKHSSFTNETRAKETIAKIKTIIQFGTASQCLSKEIQSYWPRARKVTAFEPINPWKDPYGETNALKVMEHQLRRRLKDEESRPGIVYIYRVDGNPGLVKIGYTTRTVKIRQEEMEFQCNRDCMILYHKEVSNAMRVEALCHADLHECRLQVYCDGCLVNHNEWFRVAPLEAYTVLNKWAKWMESSPYETRSLRGGDLGYLKDSIRLKDMAKFKKDPTSLAE